LSSGRSKSRKVCIFGDGRTATKEDVLGKWTAKYLPKKGSYVLVDQGQTPTARSRTAGSLAAIYRPRIVCSQCNNTWMSQLEQRAESAGLGFMIRPHKQGDVQLTLDPQQQSAIATWASKVALLTPYLYRVPQFVWVQHLAAFHKATRPPDDFAVWLGTYGGTGPYFSIHPGRVNNVPIPGNFTTFHLGHVVFQVFQGEGGSPYTSRSPDVAVRAGGPVLLRLWPPRDREIEWPTAAMRLDLLQRLAGLAPAAVPR